METFETGVHYMEWTEVVPERHDRPSCLPAPVGGYSGLSIAKGGLVVQSAKPPVCLTGNPPYSVGQPSGILLDSRDDLMDSAASAVTQPVHKLSLLFNHQRAVSLMLASALARRHLPTSL